MIPQLGDIAPNCEAVTTEGMLSFRESTGGVQ
jgi:hypothetical protein